MDHIPQATRSPHQKIEVPFFVTKKFESFIFDHDGVSADSEEGDDSSNPRLCINFDEDEDLPAQTLVTTRDILDFYQARCFFGLLADMYTLAERKFDVGTYLEHEDKGQAVISTKNLLVDLEAIAVHENSLSDDEKAAKFLSLDASIQETENLTALLQSFIVDRSACDGQTSPIVSEDLWVLLIVTESAAMLRETLVAAARQIYMPSIIPSGMEQLFGRELPPAPVNLLCKDRFEKAGWCPWHAAEAAETSLKSRSVLFALSSINRNIGGCLAQNHEDCSIEGCILNNIDSSTYQTLHTPDCDNIETCPMVPAEESERKSQNASEILSRIVRKGCIPAIRLLEKGASAPLLSVKSYRPFRKQDGPNLRARKGTNTESGAERLGRVPYRETVIKLRSHAPHSWKDHGVEKEKNLTSGAMARLLEDKSEIRAEDGANGRLPYIAISHVWSQGLGNNRSNAIWLCQLRRLQRYANRLVPRVLRPIPLWIDTICVPLAADARMAAIKSMDAVYQNALAVLVVDNTLTDFDLAPVLEIERQKWENGAEQGLEGWQKELLMRIKASPWAQRLWTYNEAYLAQQLYFQTGYRGRFEIPAVWSQDIFIPTIGDPVTRMFLPDEDVHDMDEIVASAAADTSTPITSSIKSPDRALLTETEEEYPDDISKPHHQTFPLEYTAGYLLTEAASLQLFGGKYSSSHSEVPDFYDDLRYLSRQLAQRTTSHVHDEAICLSTLLGLGPEKVLVGDDDQEVAAEDRMKRLWEVLDPGRIPAEVIFCNRPFYGNKGQGWMVRRFSRDRSGNWINHLGCGNLLRKDPEMGALVQMGGLQFETLKPTGQIEEQNDRGSSLWNAVFHISGFKYSIIAVEASEPIPTWRSSSTHGKFAILMPPSELEALLKGFDDRVHGSGSLTAELPFGLLVNVIIEPKPYKLSMIDYESPGIEDSDAGFFHVARREMVEFEVVLDGEDFNSAGASSGVEIDAETVSDSRTEDEVSREQEDEQELSLSQPGISAGKIISPKILPRTQKWWIG
ncbi:hypothetical protein MMC21_007176 [Puttea exsequens]|nr:hypothetical protein [Puttea exsequens]